MWETWKTSCRCELSCESFSNFFYLWFSCCSKKEKEKNAQEMLQCGRRRGDAFSLWRSVKMENLLKGAELQQPYRRPWWQPILGDKCRTQAPPPPPQSISILKMALFSSTCSAFTCRPEHHTLPCLFFFYQRRWFCRSKRLQSSLCIPPRLLHKLFSTPRLWNQRRISLAQLWIRYQNHLQFFFSCCWGLLVGSTLGQGSPRAPSSCLRSIRHVGA